MSSSFLDLKKILKSKEAKSKIFFTFLAVLVYRFGSFVVLPGVDLTAIEQQKSTSGLVNLLDIFVGGAFSNISVLALGIMPYISASIIIQLLTAVLPYFQRMRQEGESGNKRIARITRYLVLVVACVQALSYLRTYALPYLLDSGVFSILLGILTLLSGTFFVMWLADRITERGLGNGASVIMLAGILSRFPQALAVNFYQRMTALPLFVLEIFAFFVVIFLAVVLSIAVRRVPIAFAKKMANLRLENSGHAQDYLPFKLNFSGVMPVIFAQTVLVVPSYFVRNTESLWADFLYPFSMKYTLLMVFLVFLFSYLYSALVFNPNSLADDLKKNSVFIPGIAPGLDTANYIDAVVFNLILPGAAFLSLHCVMPTVARNIGINPEFAVFFGGTSLLIAVSVALDLVAQLSSIALQVKYDKFI